MKANVSINDFSPLLRSPEYVFKKLAEINVQGIELGIGFKSRWSPLHYKQLSEKYNIPIKSLHQPLWSYMDIHFDKGAFDIGALLGVESITCHPLAKISYDHPKMEQYFRKLANVQDKSGIEVLIENLPMRYNHRILNKLSPPNRTASNLLELSKVVKKYNFNITFDTDHLQSIEPHKHPDFLDIYPQIRNIHISSFTKNKHHLSLREGKFRTDSFLKFLKNMKYDHLLTLEVGHPSITLTHYDIKSIEESLDHLKS